MSKQAMPGEMPDTAVCIGFWYALFGLPESVCAECGRAFDAEDASTFRWRPGAMTWRQWAVPPRNWHLISVFALTALLIVESSEPRTRTLSMFSLGCMCLPLAGLVLIVIVADYVGRVVATFRDRARAALDRPYKPRRALWRWFVLPMALAIMVSIITIDWPLRIRFNLSRAAFEQAAHEFRAGQRDAGPQVIGLYQIDSIIQDGEEVMLVTGWFLDSVGFVHRPDDPREYGARRLAPRWYVGEW